MKWCMGLMALVACSKDTSGDTGARCTDECDDTDTPADTDVDTDTVDTDTEAPTDTDTDTDTAPAGIEIAGEYVDDFSAEHTITDASWSMRYPPYDADVFHLLSYDNALDYAIAHNDPANSFNGGLYSRFDWFDDGASLWYCQTAYGAADQAEAEATPRADTSDTMAGCGGFAWTTLTP